MATQQSLAQRTEGLNADAVTSPQRPFDFYVHRETQTHMQTHGSFCVF